MTDYSDSVARDRVDDDEDDGVGHELRLRPRAPLLPAVSFGSWGVLIAIPTTLFFIEGELPRRGLPVAVGVALLGYVLLYAAVRAVVNRAVIRIEARQVVFSRGPLGPVDTRRVPLADIVAVRARQRSPSFFHPARHRGLVMPQPFFVDLVRSDGTRVTLPTTLGRDDALRVVTFVDSQR